MMIDSDGTMEKLPARCATCRYGISLANPMEIGQKVIECRRYPPSVFPANLPGGQPGQVARITMWPVVEENMGCGEHSSLVRIKRGQFGNGAPNVSHSAASTHDVGSAPKPASDPPG